MSRMTSSSSFIRTATPSEPLTIVVALLLAATAMCASSSVQAQGCTEPHHIPPTALLAEEDFTDEAALDVASGNWVASGGTYRSTSTATAIATISEYMGDCFFDTTGIINEERFSFRARMQNERSGANTRVGIVYLYQDAANYYEALFSPAGSVDVREVANGLATTVATGTYRGGGQGVWFDVEVAWSAAGTIILVNGVPVLTGIVQDDRTTGRVGLITSGTTAKFDRLLAFAPHGDQEFREDFAAGAPPSWTPVDGAWMVVDGVYRNSAVEQTNITLMPIAASFRQTDIFTVRARMLNPYGASGNLIGMVYGYSMDGFSANYKEVVFGPDGIAHANEVWHPLGGRPVVTPIGTAPYPGRRNQWFDVRLDVDRNWGGANVIVDGERIFTDLASGQNELEQVGLITHWSPGRFDDVWFHHGNPRPIVDTFDSVQDPEYRTWIPASGTWDTTGGVLSNRSAGVRDIIVPIWSAHRTDYKFSARMLNPYGASGNRIGLVFSHDWLGDYYEVVFAPTGQAYLNRYVQGSLTELATATHAIGRNVWFEVELYRHGRFATVKLNGLTLFANIPAAQLDPPSRTGGHVGVVSHWAPGRFDDVRVEEYPAR